MPAPHDITVTVDSHLDLSDSSLFIFSMGLRPQRTWALLTVVVGVCSIILALLMTSEDTNNTMSAAPPLPSPLARTILKLRPVSSGIPKQVKVTRWGSPLETARHVVFYFGGMPASAEEPAMHSSTTEDVYASRNIHLVAVDKPGMGESSVAYRFSLRRDWPQIISMVADELKIEQKYAVIGMSNGGPYVMSCLTHPELKHRVKAGSMVVGVSDVWASGYFSWRNPSCFVEGIYNSLPIIVTGPLNALGLSLGKIYVMSFGGFESVFGDTVPKEAKPVFKRLLSDGAANFGLGSAIDCQQGLSPFYARPTSNTSPDNVNQAATEAYKSIQVPVSLWYGTKDSSVPMASAEWLKDLVPNSSLHKVDSDHGLFFRHTEQVLDDLVERMEEADRMDSSSNAQ